MALRCLVLTQDLSLKVIIRRALDKLDIETESPVAPGSVPVIAEQEERFNAVIVDFDEPDTARHLLEALPQSKPGALITMALLREESSVREILQNGAKFILHKPVTAEQASATLRAATSLLRRERRRSYRVPVQAPVQIRVAGEDEIEGILLDVSQTGIDVLAAQALHPAALIGLRFTLPDGSVEVDAQGEVAWANSNGQSGVRFLEVPASQAEKLNAWVQANTPDAVAEEAEPVSLCKLTDLSLGGCYVQTDAPFPERALDDLCLKAEEHEVHTEGMVRVAHPGHGMGVEFPSRTPEQRAQVSNLISFLRTCPATMLELIISPRALVADITQFEPGEKTAEESSDEMEDPLLDLLRRGTSLQQDDFFSELQHQRSPEETSV